MNGLVSPLIHPCDRQHMQKGINFQNSTVVSIISVLLSTIFFTKLLVLTIMSNETTCLLALPLDIKFLIWKELLPKHGSIGLTQQVTSVVMDDHLGPSSRTCKHLREEMLTWYEQLVGWNA